jgi:hypothetical protein
MRHIWHRGVYGRIYREDYGKPKSVQGQFMLRIRAGKHFSVPCVRYSRHFYLGDHKTVAYAASDHGNRIFIGRGCFKPDK